MKRFRDELRRRPNTVRGLKHLAGWVIALVVLYVFLWVTGIGRGLGK